MKFSAQRQPQHVKVGVSGLLNRGDFVWRSCGYGGAVRTRWGRVAVLLLVAVALGCTPVSRKDARRAEMIAADEIFDLVPADWQPLGSGKPMVTPGSESEHSDRRNVAKQHFSTAAGADVVDEAKAALELFERSGWTTFVVRCDRIESSRAALRMGAAKRIDGVLATAALVVTEPFDVGSSAELAFEDRLLVMLEVSTGIAAEDSARNDVAPSLDTSCIDQL